MKIKIRKLIFSVYIAILNLQPPIFFSHEQVKSPMILKTAQDFCFPFFKRERETTIYINWKEALLQKSFLPSLLYYWMCFHTDSVYNE